MPEILTFLLPDGDGQSRGLGRAAVELGLRLGLPFRVVRNAAAMPSDGWAVACPGAVLPEGSRGVTLAPGAGPSTSVTVAGRVLYGPQAASGVDVVTGTARLLAFEAEAGAPRDAMGRVSAATHPLALDGLLLEPLIENAAAHLMDLLEAAGHSREGVEPPFAGRRAVVLNHDTDGPRLHDAFQLARAAALAPRNARERSALATGLGTLLRGRPDPYWNFDGWRALAEKAGGRNTFYVYPGPVPGLARHPRDPHYDPRKGPYPAALRRLVDAGCEVGLHYGIGTDDTGHFEAERAQLSDLTGQAPIGGRAHYWRIDWSDPHAAWDRMAAAGLGYDASLSPMTLGYRTGTMLPVLGGAIDPSGPPETPFLVLPSPVMDAYIEPGDPGGPGPAQADRLVANAVGGGLVVLNWHVRTLTDVGPWQGFGREARRIMGAIAEDSESVLMTGAEVAEAWRARITSLWRPA